MRRHRYNTRSSAAFPNTNCEENLSRSSSDDRQNERHRMDYCHQVSRRPPRSTINWFQTFLLILLLGMAASLYLLFDGFCAVKSEIAAMKELQQKELKKPKIDKSCLETLKKMLKDPTGRPDFALESTGGKVVKFSDTTNYSPRKTLFGISLCDGQHGPHSIIQATSSPGECWAFSGSTAKIMIQLIGPVVVDAVTLEHISRDLSPTGNLETAPQDFIISGSTDEYGENKKILGQFKYDNSGDPIQTFKINNTDFFGYVELNVLSNYGSKEFTCVYRLRVHGTPGKFT